jgi:hypothetical protein
MPRLQSSADSCISVYAKFESIKKWVSFAQFLIQNKQICTRKKASSRGTFRSGKLAGLNVETRRGRCEDNDGHIVRNTRCPFRELCDQMLTAHCRATVSGWAPDAPCRDESFNAAVPM